MKNWGRSGILTLVLAFGLAVAGPAAAGIVQTSPGEKQYKEEPPAAVTPTPDSEPQVEPQAEPEIFLPPTVASAGQDESDSGGLLPFTGAALIVPSVLGGLLLAGGLFLVYRTRRREEV